MAEMTCSELSTHHDEPIEGTALADTWQWIALEVRQPWPAKIEDCEALPLEVRQHLDALLAARPAARLIFIRRPLPDEAAPLACYVGRSRPEAPAAWRFDLDEHGQLPALGLGAVLDGDDPRPEARVEAPVTLICAHGKRDRCCALHGVALYKSLAELAPEHTWQASHLGGHRFAATALLLPHGVQYGRLRASDAPALHEAHARGELLATSGRYRGRTCHGPSLQAAEALLIERTGHRALGGPTLIAHTREGSATTATFALPDGTRHTLTVTPRSSEAAWRFSCDKPSVSHATLHELVSHTSEAAP